MLNNDATIVASGGMAAGSAHRLERGYKMRPVQSVCLAFACAMAMTVAVGSNAKADIYSTDNGNTLSQVPGMGSVTVSPAYSEFIGSCPTVGGACSGTTATGPSNLSIATQTTWLNDNTDWDPVSGGVQIAGSQATGSGTFNAPAGTSYSIWAVHGDSWYLAFLFASAITQFAINNLPNAISGVFAFNPGTSVVPLPPALILFGTALAGLGVLGRRRKKKNGLAQAT
jgi:hypothetical protein